MQTLLFLSGTTSSLSLKDFFDLLGSSPILIITVLLALGVVFINGWTDAPNSIATCISTRSLPPRTAIIIASVFNFLGVIIFGLFSVSVAESIANMVDFGPIVESATITADQAIGNAHYALIGMISGMLAVILWGVIAWYFGVPSSQTHSLVAGLTGSAFAMMTHAHDVIPGAKSWINVGLGFVISGVIGLALGYGIAKLIQLICRKMVRRKTTIFFKYSQAFAAAGLSFAHGAQDGLQFVGLIYILCKLAAAANPSLGIAVDSTGMGSFLNAPEFLWLPVLVALFMGLGTSIGGYRIIKKIGMGIVSLEPFEGFTTDLAAFISLLISTIFGWPVSTSQVKTYSIIGVGTTKGMHKVNWRTAGQTVLSAFLTFPACILMGFLVTYIVLWIPGI